MGQLKRIVSATDLSAAARHAADRAALISAATGAPLDLSLAALRSVSPIHCEYLRNMGVSATMTVSILREGRLWGLFSCHHGTPYHVAYERRTAAELFGQMVSLVLDSRERAVEMEYESAARRIHERMMTLMAADATALSRSTE